MAERGRKPKANKKEREAIYVEPELLKWVRDQAESRQRTVSEFVCEVLQEKKEQEG